MPAMEKLIYLLGDAQAGATPRNRIDLRDSVLGRSGAIRDAGAQSARLCVADLDDPAADSFPQLNADGLIDAALLLWVDSLDERREIESVVSRLATRHAGYLVTESVPLERKPAKQTAGPLPGVTLFSTFPKPDRVDDDIFFARWHGSHTPLSLAIHPLLAYLRHTVARPLTAGAPPLRAIVSETTESAAVFADPERFYGGADNQKRAIQDLLSFVEIQTMSNALMREYELSG